MIKLGTKPPAAHHNGLPAGIVVLMLACLLGGCATSASTDHQNTVIALANKVQALENQLIATQAAIASLNSNQLASQATLSKQLTKLNDDVDKIPAEVTAICGIPPSAAECGVDQPVHTVILSGDKMVVGELEKVWIDPPGAMVIARVDTGANVSSLHAGNLVEFERDGDDWVRFELILDNEIVTLERPVSRHVRIFQQADQKGSRRPVVSMRLRLGDIQDTFEFTLADRAHLDFQMLLGRNFLSDVTLVDVGKQFVQPHFKSNRE
jgi:hypothetical protein